MIRLGTRQAAALRQIVKTNGGGVCPITSPDVKMVMRLHELGLVQGKKGQDGRVVHTAAGLDWVRNNGQEPRHD